MKRKILAVLLVAAMTLALAGCNSSNNSSTSSETSSGSESSSQASSSQSESSPEVTSTEMNIIFGGTLEVYQKEYISDEFIKDFEDEYGVKVNVDYMAQDDTISKIQTEQETGNIVTDVLYVDTAHMAPYINGGWMEDITEVVESTGVTYTNMFDASTNKDGSRYFVPTIFDVYLLIANKEALKYLPEGVTQEDVENGLSWEQYADWAVNIAAGEGEGKTMMPASMTGSQLLYPMSGMSLAYGGGFPDFSSDGFKDALGIIAKIAAGNGFYAEQDQYTAVTEPMNNGDVWLAFSHMAPAGESYNAAPNNFVIGAAPHGSAGAGSTSGAWCYGIQKGAPHEDLAKLFIQYVSRPEVNYDYCSNFGGALSPIEEVGNVLTEDDAIMQAGINILEDAIVTGVPSTQYSDWNAVKLLYGDVFNETLSKKAVPDDAFLQQKQQELEALYVGNGQ